MNKELNLNINEHHNFSKFPLFWVDKVKYNKMLIEKYFNEITNNKACWDVPSTCIKDLSVGNKKKKVTFFIKKNEQTSISSIIITYFNKKIH